MKIENEIMWLFWKLGFVVKNLIFQVDLEDIKEAYEECFYEPLDKIVLKKCTGNYQKMLLNIIQGNKWTLFSILTEIKQRIIW